MDISIIIVNYNVKDFLYRCLRSIEAASDGLSIETIVVDNASDDHSVETLSMQFTDVKFISLTENLGFSKANNIGLEAAIGQYTLILNPDTILQEGTLRAMKDYMDRSPDVAAAGCKVLNADGSFQLSCRRGFPTPWASFSKLFGLQSMFPKSKLFSQYNQTFRSIDETYEIDAIIGAFMFCRTSLLKKLGGFDTEFFMYGEDLDLCFRIKKAGWKIMYFHETSIIHYKGISARRSAFNEVKVFYNAMEIYARKHYSSSGLFIVMLRLGIKMRSLYAYFIKYRLRFICIILDLFIVNFSLALATKVRFGDFLNFPPYAYPTVFIVISLVLFSAMTAVGEYFENIISIRKSFIAHLITFFFLSSLTYFFLDFAFSRGVVLMTIGFSMLLSSCQRSIILLLKKTKGAESDKRILIVGINYISDKFISSIEKSTMYNSQIIGLVRTNEESIDGDLSYPILGNIKYLKKIIEDFGIDEVLITDKSITNKELIEIISNRESTVRFHIANEFEDFLTSNIIDDISGIEPSVPIYKLNLFRYKILKRLIDLIISLFFLSIGFPVLILLFGRMQNLIKSIFEIFIGKKSFIGTYPINGDLSKIGKFGLIGMAQISRPDRLSTEAKIKLNDFYRMNYSLSLDFGIFFRFIIRKLKRGK
ncbi:MAG: glycosyltransferase [Candidatus Kapabacteria bacterium]|nr:glycosyltransferase [Candidatus Kapabacteria bacterium]